jgi:thiol-disulfide isomerase/thioredoxin
MTGTVIWAVGAVALSVRPDTGQALPALEVTSLEGRPMNLAAFKGKPTVVNLWATWCPPCVREMPVLHQAQLERPGVNFVFLNQGESGEQVSAWLQARNLPMRNVLIDANWQAGAAFKQRALPTTLFFDAKGRLVSTRVGELSPATLSERLQALAD